MELPIDESFSYVEPSTLGEIHKERPEMARKLECSMSDEANLIGLMAPGLVVRLVAR